jgi:hypothetical protein
MRALLVGAVITLSLVFGAGLVGAVSYISAYNTGNRLEQNIKAAYDQNKNVLSQYSNKVAEAAQIPAMQRDDLTKVVEAALKSRYGADGSRAMFQWIQEQNPNINSEVYTKLQQIIEAGRNDFQQSQTEFIDKKRVYETQLGYLWRGFWLRTAGYPKIDLNAYKIVTDDKTEEAFKTGKQTPIKLR